MKVDNPFRLYDHNLLLDGIFNPIARWVWWNFDKKPPWLGQSLIIFGLAASVAYYLFFGNEDNVRDIIILILAGGFVYYLGRLYVRGFDRATKLGRNVRRESAFVERILLQVVLVGVLVFPTVVFYDIMTSRERLEYVFKGLWVLVTFVFPQYFYSCDAPPPGYSRKKVRVA